MTASWLNWWEKTIFYLVDANLSEIKCEFTAGKKCVSSCSNSEVCLERTECKEAAEAWESELQFWLICNENMFTNHWYLKLSQFMKRVMRIFDLIYGTLMCVVGWDQRTTGKKWHRPEVIIWDSMLSTQSEGHAADVNIQPAEISNINKNVIAYLECIGHPLVNNSGRTRFTLEVRELAIFRVKEGCQDSRSTRCLVLVRKHSFFSRVFRWFWWTAK